MLQFIPLFIEITLLAAAGYLYWATRRLVARASIPTSLNGGERLDVNEVAMMREVTTLLAEWQAAANSAREDWIHQQTTLQETLKHAEKIIVELRAQIEQVETQQSVGEVAQNHNSMEMTQPAHLPTRLPATWAEAMTAFGDHLRSSGYSQRTVIRTLNHVQRFAARSGQQFPAQTPVCRIESAKIDDYSCYLETQNLQPNEVECELVTIKTFSNWINYLFDSIQPQRETYLAFIPETLTHPALPAHKFAPIRGIERYRSVFTMAEQGLDQSAITAQTGLEREAIQLLLTMGSPLSVNHQQQEKGK